MSHELCEWNGRDRGVDMGTGGDCSLVAWALPLMAAGLWVCHFNCLVSVFLVEKSEH